jgi:hypothetical protein
LQGIKADLEVHERPFGLIEWKAVLVLAHVTTIAVLVRHGVTDLTTDPVFMNSVLLGVFGFFIIDILVTVCTFWTVFHLISVGIILAISMHLIRLVTFGALKVLFFVDIRRDPLVLSKVLFFNTAPVACRTDQMHGRPSLEKMHVQEPAVDGFRTANMALTATAVAMKTVVLHGLIYLCKHGLVGTGPRVDNLLIGGQAHMKATLIMLGNLLVAVSTGF